MSSSESLLSKTLKLLSCTGIPATFLTFLGLSGGVSKTFLSDLEGPAVFVSSLFNVSRYLANLSLSSWLLELYDPLSKAFSKILFL